MGRAVVNDGKTLSYRDGKPAPTDAQLAAAFPVPNIVEMWRLRAVLTAQGLADAVGAIIAALPEPQRTVVSTAWQYGNTVARTSPTVTALAGALQLTPEQVAEIFIAADAIAI